MSQSIPAKCTGYRFDNEVLCTECKWAVDDGATVADVVEQVNNLNTRFSTFVGSMKIERGQRSTNNNNKR